jgi:hypothetical protein
MEVGDEVYCKAECFSHSYNEILFTKGDFYKVISVLNSIVIIMGNKRTTSFFYVKVIGVSKKFKEYFFTKTELRKEKLLKLKKI